ncbi:hypothetical protein FDG04_02170 [Clostridium sporogenes]|nr:hypothetical protein [Clostridium sporogenes]
MKLVLSFYMILLIRGIKMEFNKIMNELIKKESIVIRKDNISSTVEKIINILKKEKEQDNSY